MSGTLQWAQVLDWIKRKKVAASTVLPSRSPQIQTCAHVQLWDAPIPSPLSCHDEFYPLHQMNLSSSRCFLGGIWPQHQEKQLIQWEIKQWKQACMSWMLVWVWVRVLYIPGWHGTLCSWECPEPLLLLPPPECSGYKCVPLHPDFQIFFETRCHCTAQAGLKFRTLLRLPPNASVAGMYQSMPGLNLLLNCIIWFDFLTFRT